MKSLRSMPSLLLLSTLLSLTSVAFAQSDAQKSFDQLKALAGTWEGTVTATPPSPEISGKSMQVTLRVTSMGNAILHEMTGGGSPDDPITMLYLDNGRLMLTHYCDAGNRPRMTGCRIPRRQIRRLRISRRCRQHRARTHAPRRLHPHRRQSSHRGLDFHGRRQADPRPHGSNAHQVSIRPGGAAVTPHDRLHLHSGTIHHWQLRKVPDG